MESIRKLIEAIKMFCSCKSTCMIGEEIKIDTNTESKNIIKISFV
mgnify:CR=1 FL=1